MEYRPRYPQPFTHAEAVLLDVPTISEEITRLQHSLRRLRETQEILQGVVQEAGSPEAAEKEIVDAIEENQGVIGSQEERIQILRLALADKGITMGPHYDAPTEPAGPKPTNSTELGANGIDSSASIEEDKAGGLHL